MQWCAAIAIPGIEVESFVWQTLHNKVIDNITY